MRVLLAVAVACKAKIERVCLYESLPKGREKEREGVQLLGENLRHL
jgi:hypothetical protein